MSLAIDPLEVDKIQDPRVDLDYRKKYLVEVGGGENTYKNVRSTSYSNSSVQFSAPPPNPNIIVDSKVYIKMKFRITATGTAVGPTLFQLGSNDALRFMPVSQVCNTIQLTLNNATVTTNISDYIEPLLRYNTNVQLREFDYSTSPSMQDQYQNYADYATYGSNRNPLANYGENANEQSRGGFNYVVISDDGSTGIIEVEVVEPIFLSPLNFAKRNLRGFIGLQTFDITLNMGDLTRIWSHSSLGETFTTFSVSIANNPEALFNYITPQVNEMIPDVNIYPYYSIDRYPTSNSAVISPSTPLVPTVFNITSSNIQLNSIPKRIYIFARRNNNTRTYLTSDTYARIDKISVNFNNKSGLLSGASSQDLYQMSVRNGLNMSWVQWYRFTGSVLCLDFAKDMSLSPIEAPGLLGSYQFQYNIDLANPSFTESIIYDLYTVVVSEGSFTIANGNCVQQIGIVSSKDILMSPEVRKLDYYDALVEQSFYGGDVMSTLKKYLPKALKVGKAVAPAAKLLTETLFPRSQPLLDAASPLLSDAADYLQKLVGSGMMSDAEARKLLLKMMKENEMKGGKKAPKKKLASRAKGAGTLQY